mmetsp:Transcript_62489/g.116141  ORF Transcript_62489/g.116141 Transcript_62489/m.116141 type:complete len:106 (+) Transcript_62489:920-1237(+)
MVLVVPGARHRGSEQGQHIVPRQPHEFARILCAAGCAGSLEHPIVKLGSHSGGCAVPSAGLPGHDNAEYLKYVDKELRSCNAADVSTPADHEQSLGIHKGPKRVT